MTPTATNPAQTPPRADGLGGGAPVRVAGLTKRYDEVYAVDDVSIDVQAGEFLSLLGPSGSGKTTILMTIAGFEEPTSGEVFVGDRSMNGVPPNKREIGMVFQRYALFPHMSVFDNVAFPLRRRRTPRAEVGPRVREALAMVDMLGYESRRPSQLSGGQQQRVALARAIVYRPPLLLMDEPLGALDKKLREQVQLELKDLQRRLGTTVIYVTHDQDEALTMSDRVVVLAKGRVEQLGTPQDLYERPVNRFVADFVGETNFVAGTVAARDGDLCTVTVSGMGELTGTASPALPEGTGHRVELAVRPQRITVAAGSKGFAGRVVKSTYSGDTVRATIALGEGIEIVARVPAHEATWGAEDDVTAGWEPQHARVYPVEVP